MCVYELSKSSVVRLEGQGRGAAFVDFVKPRWLDVWDKPTTQQDFEAVKVPIHVKSERKKNEVQQFNSQRNIQTQLSRAVQMSGV